MIKEELRTEKKSKMKFEKFVNLKDNFSQIYAIAEKNVKLQLRFKLNWILGMTFPILGIILPLIVMGQLFGFSDNFGPWNRDNFVVYQFTSYQISLIYQIMSRFQGNIALEKGGNTLPAIFIAPFKRINLLLGIFCTHIVLIFIPFMFFFVLCYLFYPISIFTIFFTFVVYLMMGLFFTGIGLIFAVLVIARENLIMLLSLPLTMAMMFSCLTLPFAFFPNTYQFFASLNPFYYIFNIVRLVWIENNIIISLSSHTLTFIIVFFTAILSPLIGLKLFNYVYDKYGITIY